MYTVSVNMMEGLCNNIHINLQVHEGLNLENGGCVGSMEPYILHFRMCRIYGFIYPTLPDVQDPLP